MGTCVLSLACGERQNTEKGFTGAQPPNPQAEDWPSSALLLLYARLYACKVLQGHSPNPLVRGLAVLCTPAFVCATLRLQGFTGTQPRTPTGHPLYSCFLCARLCLRRMRKSLFGAIAILSFVESF